MLKIKVKEGAAEIKINGSLLNTLSEFVVGARALAESIDEQSEKAGKYFRKLFEGSDFYIAAFGTDEDRENAIAEMKKKSEKTRDEMKKEVLKMAEGALIDNDEDEVGKKLVGKIKEMLEDCF